MELSADETYLIFDDDEYLESVGFRDSSADFCVVLSRFSEPAIDDGKIEVVVRDQINVSTDNLKVLLRANQFVVYFDDSTASKLLGISNIDVRFDVTSVELHRMAVLLRSIFRGLDGLTIDCD